VHEWADVFLDGGGHGGGNVFLDGGGVPPPTFWMGGALPPLPPPVPAPLINLPESHLNLPDNYFNENSSVRRQTVLSGREGGGKTVCCPPHLYQLSGGGKMAYCPPTFLSGGALPSLPPPDAAPLVKALLGEARPISPIFTLHSKN
jgi:hypothetical protein